MRFVHPVELEHRLAHEEEPLLADPPRDAQEGVQLGRVGEHPFAQSPRAAGVRPLWRDADGAEEAPEVVAVGADIVGPDVPLKTRGPEVLDGEEGKGTIEEGLGAA